MRTMLIRLIALPPLAWMLGFVWFAITLPQPADERRTDAVVVLTGGSGRIERALEVMADERAGRLLISGVDRQVKRGELAAQYPQWASQFDCCVDLGVQAVDTRSNALETARWRARREVGSLRLITSDWHMRRARLELDRALPDNIEILSDAVATEPSMKTLLQEYNKFITRSFAALLGV